MSEWNEFFIRCHLLCTFRIDGQKCEYNDCCCWLLVFFGVVVVVKASIMCSLVLDAVSATKDISKLQIAHTIQVQ